MRDAARDGTGPRVLLIDEPAAFRDQLGAALSHAGYQVLTATTGEDGLRIAAQSRPAAIVVDGALPGIHGATVIHRVRLDPALRGTPCLLLTDSVQAHAETEAFEAGADAFIHKAEDVDCVLAHLRANLRRSEPPPENMEAGSTLGRACKVLAIDPSADYLAKLAPALRAEGFDALSAGSEAEAMQALAAHDVDCILLDLDMPGVDAEALVTYAGARDIPLMMLATVPGRDALARALDAGADDYVFKSSEVEGICAHVRAQLRRREFERERRREREAQLERKLSVEQARAAQQLADTRARLVEQLEYKNRELESFSASVSHDLRAPLRSILGFSDVLLEEHATSLSPAALDCVQRVHGAAQRMAALIDDLLKISRVASGELTRTPVNLSELATAILTDLKKAAPDRELEIDVQEGLWAVADARLLRVVLDNLLGNAWKFTGRTPGARIEFGARRTDEAMVYFVRDDGAGFDMTYRDKLFRPFHRLHPERGFPGTGVGLCTVQRIVRRHGGQIWAEGHIDHGATFYFTLPAPLCGSVQ